MFNKENIKDVLSLALPAVGEMILYMTISVLDTMMVGRYGGQTSVSAVGLSVEVIYTFINIFIAVGISIGITSVVARRFGAKKFQSAEEYASIGFCIGLIISLIISILLFTNSSAILRIGGAKNNVISLGNNYMKIIALGSFFTMQTSMLNGVLRGYGNTKTPLFVSLIINIINISLDWVLIFGKLGFPELGVKGAAIATSIAQISGFLFAAFYMLTKSKIKLRLKYILNLNLSKLKKLLILAIPSSFQEAAFDISRLLSAFMIMRLGETAFAANQITTTIESVSFMPGWGFGVAATTLIGHKIGEKNFKEAKIYAYTCTILGTIFMALCAAMFLIAPNFLIKLFITESEKQVIHLGSLCLMVAAIEQIPMGISLILGGALKGMGDTKTPFIVSLISSWGIRLPLMFYFVSILKTSVVYVWWITGIQWIIDGIIMFILFKKAFNKLENNT
ncbi:multidrug transporter MatE [Clostridium novyi A str. 4552]|uniref:Probable multidrug resistance protein NorM n=1 Tax=Clostridium novyi A str. 4552 TaxID=1444289 RepID=A0A0A0HXN3_CLONO|nr:MATE family efflux transporter [Clostridium novyi]KGM93969.1 multidrug transporter MatE [Clostridium novyi A str. 4552]